MREAYRTAASPKTPVLSLYTGEIAELLAQLQPAETAAAAAATAAATSLSSGESESADARATRSSTVHSGWGSTGADKAALLSVIPDLELEQAQAACAELGLDRPAAAAAAASGAATAAAASSLLLPELKLGLFRHYEMHVSWAQWRRIAAIATEATVGLVAAAAQGAAAAAAGGGCGGGGGGGGGLYYYYDLPPVQELLLALPRPNSREALASYSCS